MKNKYNFKFGQEIKNGILYRDEAGKGNSGQRFVEVLYPCGNVSVVSLAHLRSGHTTSFAGVREQKLEGFIKVSSGELVEVDDSDWSWLAKRNWTLNNTGYCTTVVEGKNKLMSRLLAEKWGWDLAYNVDHINHNKLDNRKENLRMVTQGENLQNARLRSDNRSGHKGVHFRKSTGRWQARIQSNGCQYHLGYFATKEEAILVRKQAEIEYHPCRLRD